MAYLGEECTPGEGIESLKDPVKWNEEWEHHLKRKDRRCPLPIRGWNSKRVTSTFVRSITGEGFLLELLQFHGEMCRQQDGLASLLSHTPEGDNFFDVWLGFSTKAREEHLLMGLVVGFYHAPAVRKMCPETRMKYLQKDSGRGFLNMLATFCPPDLSGPRSSPIFLSHPAIDSELFIDEEAPPEEQNEEFLFRFRYLTCGRRNFYLVQFLEAVVRRICGLKWPPSRPPSKVSNEKEVIRAWRKPFKRKQTAEDTLRKTLEMKEAFKKTQFSCYHCGICESELPEGEKFLLCAECKKVGMKVVYCGKDCQMNNWKTGYPAHRTFCGKRAKLPQVHTTPLRNLYFLPEGHPEELEYEDSDEDNFQPTMDLRIQRFMLEENPAIDYYYFPPHSLFSVAIELPDLRPFDRRWLERIKRCAMVTGEPAAVASLYNFFAPTLDRDGWQPRIFVTQLSKEYNVPRNELVELLKKSPHGYPTRFPPW